MVGGVVGWNRMMGQGGGRLGAVRTRCPPCHHALRRASYESLGVVWGTPVGCELLDIMRRVVQVSPWQGGKQAVWSH